MPQRPAASMVSRWEQATHSGGCGFWRGFGQDVAQREVEVGAVVLHASVAEHRDQGAHGVLEHLALVAEAPAEGVQLGDVRPLAEPELDAPVADQVEGRDALGHARRVVGGELHDAVAEADALGALARRGQEDLGRRGMRVLLEEVVLDLPGVVVAEPVGELDLLERALQQAILAVLVPRSRQLVLVEDPELHGRLLDPSARPRLRQPMFRATVRTLHCPCG